MKKRYFLLLFIITFLCQLSFILCIHSGIGRGHRTINRLSIYEQKDINIAGKNRDIYDKEIEQNNKQQREVENNNDNKRQKPVSMLTRLNNYNKKRVGNELENELNLRKQKKYKLSMLSRLSLYHMIKNSSLPFISSDNSGQNMNRTKLFIKFLQKVGNFTNHTKGTIPTPFRYVFIFLLYWVKPPPCVANQMWPA